MYGMCSHNWCHILTLYQFRLGMFTDRETTPDDHCDLWVKNKVVILATVFRVLKVYWNSNITFEDGLVDVPTPIMKLDTDMFQWVYSVVMLLLCPALPYSIRSTPVETLHTILLGPYKYLLCECIKQRSPQQKTEIQVRILTFNPVSGVSLHIMLDHL